jgi:hypothetical protein
MTAFITGEAIPRRTVLRGFGAAIALPFLESMAPAFRWSSFAAPVRRFQTFYVPNGMAMDYWTPKTFGAGFELTPILEPLAPFRNQVQVLSGIDATWNQIHAGASGSFLTGVAQGGRTEVEIIDDVSMDQLVARRIGRETQVQSLELSMDAPANAGACSSNLSCVYTHTLSWAGPTQPLPMEHNPRAVFERLFGDAGSTERGARAQRLVQQKSILDSVMEKMSGLERQVGSSDQVRLDEYLGAIRDVERRIQIAEAQIDEIEIPDMPQPEGVPAAFEDHLELMLDLQALALQSDLTRVITFMIGKEQSARPYPQIGVAEAHHPLSHHNNVSGQVQKMSEINRYHVQLFARYLDKLSRIPDGDAMLLDNMMLLYGSGISNSTVHSGRNLPLLVVGGGGGRLEGGRHLKYEDSPPMANLLVSLMEKLDVPVDNIGISTGTLPMEPLSGV